MTKCNNLGLKNYDYGDKSDLYHFISFLKSGIYLAFLGLFVNVTRLRNRVTVETLHYCSKTKYLTKYQIYFVKKYCLEEYPDDYGYS